MPCWHLIQDVQGSSVIQVPKKSSDTLEVFHFGRLQLITTEDPLRPNQAIHANAFTAILLAATFLVAMSLSLSWIMLLLLQSWDGRDFCCYVLAHCLLPASFMAAHVRGTVCSSLSMVAYTWSGSY